MERNASSRCAVWARDRWRLRRSIRWKGRGRFRCVLRDLLPPPVAHLLPLPADRREHQRLSDRTLVRNWTPDADERMGDMMHGWGRTTSACPYRTPRGADRDRPRRWLASSESPQPDQPRTRSRIDRGPASTDIGRASQSPSAAKTVARRRMVAARAAGSKPGLRAVHARLRSRSPRVGNRLGRSRFAS